MNDFIGIKEVIVEYIASKSTKFTEVANEKGWTDYIPRLNKDNRYLWNRGRIIYTTGEEVVTSPLFIHEYTNTRFDRLIIFIKKLFM